MGRIRTIKPEFWRHAVMATLPDETQLLALALLTASDDFGYFEADARLIRGEVMPFREDLARISRSVAKLSEVGWIEVRECAGHSDVGRVVNWERHQRVDHPKPSKLKEYFDSGAPREDFARTSREPRENFALEQGTGNREVEVEQGSGRGAGNAREARKPRARKGHPPEVETDPRHAPLVAALVEACPGYAFDGGRDAAAVKKLLSLAEPEEVLRRWRRALTLEEYPKVRAIHELATHWNHFAGNGLTAAGERPYEFPAHWKTA